MKKVKKRRKLAKERKHRIKDIFDLSRLKHGSTHHIVPTSREGPKKTWNERLWAKKEHQAWHQLFHNYLPSEAITIIEKEWTLPDGKLNKKKIGSRFVSAWKKVFGRKSPKEAIKYIEKEFLPAEIRFFSELE